MKTTVMALEEAKGHFAEHQVYLNPLEDEEVIVDIVASGICHSDFHILDGQTPAQFPVTLGHEGAGVVRKVGSRVKLVKVRSTV